MRFTRPSSDRRFSHAVVAACGVLSCAAVHCSSDDERTGFSGTDAASEASLPEAGVDASWTDDASRDAAPFDVTPLPIVCTTEPCAVALTSSTIGESQTLCALLRDGTVVCWGANDQGQLGRGDEAGVADSATPSRVAGLTDVVAIHRTCAVDKHGSAYCWGKGPFLKGGASTPTRELAPSKLPLSGVERVSTSSNVGCAVLEDGVQCWGDNFNAQVAPFDGNNRYTTLPPHTVPLPAGRKARDIAVGNATLVILDDGTMVSWGGTPPLGRATSLSPDPLPQPLALPGITTAIEMEVDNACAAVSGVGYCWGAGPPNSRFVDLSRALPVPIVIGEPVRQASITSQRVLQDPKTNELYTAPDRWCAVGAEGAVYCWGNNESGQAGDGTKSFAYQAVKVSGLPAPAVKVEAMFDATCGLLTNGTIYCWGSDFYGQLGSGKLKVSSLIPQKVKLP